MRVEIAGIPEEHNVNTSIHPLKGEDKAFANAEVEKAEIILDPETMALHKATGKRHSQGGTPVSLKEGSFIFSDFNKLSLNKQDAKEMDFKGFKGRKTPAKVVERELPGGILHHNKMVNILGKPHKYDNVTQQTAQLMLQKNMEKLGQIAFKQEEKKSFPQGLPDISNFTAPVVDSQLLQDMKKASQYTPQKMQDGGDFINNWFNKNKNILYGYDPNFFMGVDLRQPASKGIFTKEQQPGLFNRYVTNANTLGLNLGTELTPENIKAYQSAAYNAAPEAIDYFYNSKNPAIRFNNKRPQSSPSTFQDGLFNRDGVQFSNIIGTSLEDIDQKAKNAGLIKKGNSYVFPNGEQATIFRPVVQPNLPQINLDKVDPERLKELQDFQFGLNKTVTPPSNTTTDQTTSEDKDPELPTIATNYNIGMTPLQKLNLAIGAGRALGVKTYYPLRQQQQSVLTQPELIDAQPYINQANQAYANSAALTRLVTNPQTAGAMVEQLGAQRLDNINKAIENVQNQNTSLINQARQQNANILNQDAAQNRAFDRTYYDQMTQALQNRDNEKEFRWNQVQNEANQYLAENQVMSNQLNSQKQYRTKVPVKDAQGNVIGFRSQLPYLPTRGFAGYNFTYNPNISAEAILNSTGDYTQSVKGDYTNQLIQKLMEDLDSSIPNVKAMAQTNLVKLLYDRNRNFSR